MGAQEDAAKKKEFQKRTDEDIDTFLARTEFQKTTPQVSSRSSQVTVEPMPAQAPAKTTAPEQPHVTTDAEQEEQIASARTSRAEREAYQDVAVLRKKAHAFGHKAAKFFHRHKANEAKAQKCSARAVAYREKAAEKKEKARDFKDRIKECESELSGAAQGKSDLSPESLRTRIANTERKVAKQDELSRKMESKAAAQGAKAAKFRTRAAKFLEQNKLFESEAKRYAKRADNLEKAGV
jgi:hypothetical protein